MWDLIQNKEENRETASYTWWNGWISEVKRGRYVSEKTYGDTVGKKDTEIAQHFIS